MSATPVARSKPASVDVFTLQSSEIDDHWFWIERFLKRVESPTWTLRHVRAELKAARAQLWTLLDERGAPKCVLITRLESFDDRPFGLIWIAAGDGLEHAETLLGEVERWFRSKGCRYVEINGRRGWERVLPGYELKAVVLVKELT